MKRLAEEFLATWFERDGRKPLMVRGARQVGKSTLVRLFAEKLGLNLIEVNLERYPGLSSEFATMDVKRIVREIDLGLGLGNAITLCVVDTQRFEFFENRLVLDKFRDGFFAQHLPDFVD